jgi:hypothetical protein
MKTFNKFVNDRTVTVLADSIVEHLCLQSEHFDPVDTLQSLFVENFGKSEEYRFVEAFDDQSGWWGNLAKGARGAARGLFGAGMAGVGGGVGGAFGGTVGAAKGAFGRSGDPTSKFTVQGGVKSGSSTGQSMMRSGLDAMKQAFANRGQAGMVSAYKKSVTALDSYVKAAQSMNVGSEEVNALQNLRNQLEDISSKIEKAMKEKAMTIPFRGSTAAAI